MWTVYLYEICFSVVILVLLTAGVIGLCSREYQRPSQGMKALALSEPERAALRTAREANLRLQAEAKARAQDPNEVKERQAAKRAAKVARKMMIREAAGRASATDSPDKG